MKIRRETVEPSKQVACKWMTADGCCAFEMPSRNMKANGGKLRISTLGKSSGKIKMSPPVTRKRKVTNSEIYNGDKVWIKVIAGRCIRVKAEINTYTPILYWHVKIQSGGKIELPL